jgi:hypothetical protein
MPESLEGGKVTIYRFSAGNDCMSTCTQKKESNGNLLYYFPQYVTDKSSEYYGYQIVDEAGQPKLDKEVSYTGLDMNHKWTGGVNTTLSSHGFSLSGTLDVRYGGAMFSRTKNLMQFTGNGVVTLYNDRNTFVIPNSVIATTDGNGSVTYEENNMPIKLIDGSYQNYFNDYGWGNGGKAYLIDRTFVKVRNITLSYTLPRKLIRSLDLNELTLSAYVNNPFIWTAKDNYYIDPESSTIGTDLSGNFGELYVNPTSRSYGLNVNIKF